MIKSVIADLVGEIFECSDGSEAFAAYREHQPDIVLMDLNMAETDGAGGHQTDQAVVSWRQGSSWFRSGKMRALRKAAQLAGAEAYVGKSDLEPLRRILAGI